MFFWSTLMKYDSCSCPQNSRTVENNPWMYENLSFQEVLKYKYNYIQANTYVL
jgi:hypothetical protein